MFLLLQHLILLPRGLLRERGGPLLKVGHLGAVLGRVVAMEALRAELAVPVAAHALLVAGHLGALALASAPHQLGEDVRPGAMPGMWAILVVEEVVAEEGVAAARRLRRDEVGLALAAGVCNEGISPVILAALVVNCQENSISRCCFSDT